MVWLAQENSPIILSPTGTVRTCAAALLCMSVKTLLLSEATEILLPENILKGCQLALLFIFK